MSATATAKTVMIPYRIRESALCRSVGSAGAAFGTTDGSRLGVGGVLSAALGEVRGREPGTAAAGTLEGANTLAVEPPGAVVGATGSIALAAGVDAVPCVGDAAAGVF
jgi:hypothetical protein